MIKHTFLYFFVIFSLGCSSNESENENIPDSNSDLLPIEPSSLVAEQRDSSVFLSWTDNSDSEDGFKIERKIGSGNYSVVANLDINTTDFTDIEVIVGNTYTYRIHSFNSYGNSAVPSNTVMVSVIDPMELVTIGSQQWMRRNLNVEYYRSGDPFLRYRIL